MRDQVALIRAKNLRRIYPPSIVGGEPLDMKFPDVDLLAGRRIALLGISGSGKSTFLNLIAGLDAPFSGRSRPASITYSFSDGTTADMADRKKAFPRHRLGFVFQEGHLITDASAGINAALPGLLNGIQHSDEDVVSSLDAMGLPAGAAGREAWRLSGGQKQRVAILRALFHQPQVIFADEPTSSLDKRTAAAIMRVLADYQEADPLRTLFWATHDLQLAAEFASDFLVVRKRPGQEIELEGPFPNPGLEQWREVEEKVYDGIVVSGVKQGLRVSKATKTKDEVRYTQAKVGGSLTFSLRQATSSLFQLGAFGRWMSSIESRPPPMLTGLLSLIRLYGRFSDRAEAYAILLAVLMTSFILIGLNTMSFYRKQAMSDPTACHVVSSAPNMKIGDSASAVELTPDLITNFNQEATWRSPQLDEPWWRSAFPVLFREPAAASTNPCGRARDLVFGRNIQYVSLRFERNGTCDASPISAPKALIASLAEPAMLESKVAVSGQGIPRRLGDLIPQGQSMRKLVTLPLTGDEIFITEGLREQLTNAHRDLPSNVTTLPLCMVDGDDERRVRIGGIVSDLPQPRGEPFAMLVPHGSPLLGPSESYEQAVFYTDPERAGILKEFLERKKFAFSREDIDKMIAASNRFSAIGQLIFIVGGIVLVSIVFFLRTSIQVFLEKNARPNAVLRAYGLTWRSLVRQIFWRLGAVSIFASAILAVVGAALSFGCYVLFQNIGLPLPSVTEVTVVAGISIVFTLFVVTVVVWLSVWLWWRQHESIAQELN
ncbi:ATP-binding cassette domain-containing protein [Bradyrhizobium sp. 83002]|uniref:ABC transporter ATP-binding protein/permease n=1 Tax=Bradyrhizobium aeschynomenes TaxID=2734909 RepID=UPI001557E0DA|nr:ATP-binding cassette domain-containing protein [Bradyrhizobium aeschynomenes]NPU13067.1 ATP-binding cassette domain-containing protein [Bradyrhizobium aeschynomenes]